MKRIKTEILKIKPDEARHSRAKIKILDFIYSEDLEIFKIDVYSSKKENDEKIKLNKYNYVTTVFMEEALVKYDELLNTYLEIYEHVPDGCELDIEGFDAGFHASDEPKHVTGELPRKLSA
jgi:hypothetical protein